LKSMGARHRLPMSWLGMAYSESAMSAMRLHQMLVQISLVPIAGAPRFPLVRVPLRRVSGSMSGIAIAKAAGAVLGLYNRQPTTWTVEGQLLPGIGGKG